MAAVEAATDNTTDMHTTDMHNTADMHRHQREVR